MKSILFRFFRAGSFALLASMFLALPAQAQNTFVRLQTTHGVIDFKLLNNEAPLTVANFRAYVQAGDFSELLFHRSSWINATTPFVIQAGGWTWRPDGIRTVISRGTVQNEFSLARSNVRGTVAMAKVGGQPNSATSQWFINTGNNAANLDNQNGGFTVFARVTTPGMAVADVINNLPRTSVGDPFFWDDFPVTVQPTNGQIFRNMSVRVITASELTATTTNVDRIFNYLEAAYTSYVMPIPSVTGEAYYYTYRYYGPSDSYLGEKDGRIWYYAPAFLSAPYDIGSTADWLAVAIAAGY